MRPDPRPRIEAFQQQLLGLQRLGVRQAQLNMASMTADRANRQLQHQIDIKVITDGEHHVLDRLDPPYRGLFQMVIANPSSPRHLGFEAQRFLASRLDQAYDMYGYFEDDLIIHDSWFFKKIDWFRNHVGDDCLLLPHRIELASDPSDVDRFFIDGPMLESDLRYVIPEPGPSLAAPCPGGPVYFESPRNPHAGCFVLSASQLQAWVESEHWLDGDCSFVSPLESAATLGISKTFRLYKPVMAMGSWLELQHWGRSFHCLIGNSVSLPDDESVQDISADKVSVQSEK
ncbi:hypothetical protein CWE16_02105 [Synechococcus sp. BS55D]|nr:hypothetical protein CWE16_02105 [Synechococcus sp. BS55D]